MDEENGGEHPQGDPEDEQGEERTRRVRPLFRFGRRSKKEETVEDLQQPEEPVPGEGTIGEEEPLVDATDDTEDGSKAPIRPVRVVKFIPPEGERTTSGAPEMEEEPFAEEEAPFVEEEEPFAAVEEAEPPFAVGEEEPFAVEEEEPFAAVEEAPFVEEEEPFAAVEEAPFVEEEEPFAAVEEAPSDMGPETSRNREEDAGAPFVFEEQVPSPQGDVAPDGTYDDMERTRWDEPVHDTISTQEEAETGEGLQFRSEESPAHMEATESPPKDVPGDAEAPPGEPKPHYHKYLKPDEDLVSRPQARGPATGFDRDMDADAGEIEFGIDLIDPSERRKKKKTPPKKQEGNGPKKGVGGHDFDGEVDSRGMGGEVGVDYNKRRKRRL